MLLATVARIRRPRHVVAAPGRARRAGAGGLRGECARPRAAYRVGEHADEDAKHHERNRRARVAAKVGLLDREQRVGHSRDLRRRGLKRHLRLRRSGHRAACARSGREGCACENSIGATCAGDVHPRTADRNRQALKKTSPKPMTGGRDEAPIGLRWRGGRRRAGGQGRGDLWCTARTEHAAALERRRREGVGDRHEEHSHDEHTDEQSARHLKVN